MKKIISLAALSVSCCILFLLQGCFKDSCRNTYTIYTPIFKNLSEVRASMKGGAPQPMVNTGKIYVYGNYIFLNELRKGIHVIDNTNPSQPKNISFINIPGNVDLAVKGNYLYADCYSDVVIFDISNPNHISVKKFMNNVIKEYGFYWGNQTNPDSVSILVDYAKRDTVVSCETYQSWNACKDCKFFSPGGVLFLTAVPQASSTGAGGSMARFTIVNDYMYSVSSSSLYAFDVSNPSDPSLKNTKNTGWGIETIFPFQNKLFIGSTSGMFIFDISNPADPLHHGYFGHRSGCDPVISDGKYAYVTLHSGTQCSDFSNQLDVLDVADITKPTLVKTYSMTNPHGLAKDGEKLFICDGKSGLKLYDASVAGNLQLLKTISGIETYDIITGNNTAIVVAKDGLYQYDYSNFPNLKLLSKIGISK